MKRIYSTTSSVLIVFFSFWFLIFPAYLYLSTADASDVNSVSTLENADEGHATPGLENHEKVIASPSPMKQMLTDFRFLAQVAYSFFQRHTSAPAPLILRF
jgi:hypothetical protein